MTSLLDLRRRRNGVIVLVCRRLLCFSSCIVTRSRRSRRTIICATWRSLMLCRRGRTIIVSVVVVVIIRVVLILAIVRVILTVIVTWVSCITCRSCSGLWRSTLLARCTSWWRRSSRRRWRRCSTGLRWRRWRRSTISGILTHQDEYTCVKPIIKEHKCIRHGDRILCHNHVRNMGTA